MKLLSLGMLLLAVVCSPQVNAQRIKDVASIQGVRANQLVGYGLVVGLPGTGEQSPFTRTKLQNDAE